MTRIASFDSGPLFLSSKYNRIIQRSHLRQVKQTPCRSRLGELYHPIFLFPSETVGNNCLRQCSRHSELLPVINIRRALICEICSGTDFDQALKSNTRFALNFLSPHMTLVLRALTSTCLVLVIFPCWYSLTTSYEPDIKR